MNLFNKLILVIPTTYRTMWETKARWGERNDLDLSGDGWSVPCMRQGGNFGDGDSGAYNDRYSEDWHWRL